MVRLAQALFRSPRLWRLVGVLAVGLFALVGGGVGVKFLFHGDETKQAFLACALISLASGMVMVARSPVMLFRNVWPVTAFVLAGALVTYGGVWNVPRYVQTHPLASATLTGALMLAPIVVGLLYVGQRPPRKPGTTFSGIYQPPRD